MLFVSLHCAGAPTDIGHSSKSPYATTEKNSGLLAERTNRFRKDLGALGFAGEVRSCSGLVVLSAGSRDSNRSYGAVCSVAVAAKKREILICDDDMVGHLALTVDITKDPEEIAHFVEQNCYGG